MDQLARLIELLSDDKLLKKQNAERVSRVFYDAAKVVYYRQNLWQKTQLKMKEIAGALVLVESFHSCAYRFNAVGELAGLFGQCPEAKALDYYEQHVMGEIEDVCGRKIRIDEDGIRSLYKEKYTGKHIEESQNYEEVRGKRLPWIRHVLKHSRGIFEKEEKVFGSFRRTFLYTAVVSIPIEPKPQVTYYVVIVREVGNKELKLVTAYNINILNRLLKAIATSHPWGRRKDEKGCG